MGGCGVPSTIFGWGFETPKNAPLLLLLPGDSRALALRRISTSTGSGMGGGTDFTGSNFPGKGKLNISGKLSQRRRFGAVCHSTKGACRKATFSHTHIDTYIYCVCSVNILWAGCSGEAKQDPTKRRNQESTWRKARLFHSKSTYSHLVQWVVALEFQERPQVVPFTTWV